MFRVTAKRTLAPFHAMLTRRAAHKPFGAYAGFCWLGLLPFHALIIASQQKKARTKSKRYSQAVSNLCLTRVRGDPVISGPRRGCQALFTHNEKSWPIFRIMVLLG